jgi:hypothetical protein
MSPDTNLRDALSLALDRWEAAVDEGRSAAIVHLRRRHALAAFVRWAARVQRELGYREIGARLGISHEAVRRTEHRALSAIRSVSSDGELRPIVPPRRSKAGRPARAQRAILDLLSAGPQPFSRIRTVCPSAKSALFALRRKGDVVRVHRPFDQLTLYARSRAA